MPPTVFADVRDDMRIAQEEIFGPVISAIPFKDMDEVVAARQRHDVRSRQRRVDARRQQGAPAWRAAIRAGSVWVNCYQAMDPAVPFGGYKMSGYGRESGLQHDGGISQRQGGLDQDRIADTPAGGETFCHL